VNHSVLRGAVSRQFATSAILRVGQGLVQFRGDVQLLVVTASATLQTALVGFLIARSPGSCPVRAANSSAIVRMAKPILPSLAAQSSGMVSTSNSPRRVRIGLRRPGVIHRPERWWQRRGRGRDQYVTGAVAVRPLWWSSVSAAVATSGAHRSSVGAEPSAQLVGRRTRRIAPDEFLDLVGVRAAGTTPRRVQERRV
jgi:hypothetical protein